MKWSNKTILGLLVAGFVTTSCEKQDFVEINKDPDALSTVPPKISCSMQPSACIHKISRLFTILIAVSCLGCNTIQVPTATS